MKDRIAADQGVAVVIGFSERAVNPDDTGPLEVLSTGRRPHKAANLAALTEEVFDEVSPDKPGGSGHKGSADRHRGVKGVRA